MTNHDFLAECKRLAEAATDGPWGHDYRKQPDNMYCEDVYDQHGENIAQIAWHKVDKGNGHTITDREDNAAFIAHSRTAIPRLVEMVEERDRELVTLREEHKNAGDNAEDAMDLAAVLEVRLEEKDKRIEELEEETMALCKAHGARVGELDAARVALRFYGDEENYKRQSETKHFPVEHFVSDKAEIHQDNGAKARAALEG